MFVFVANPVPEVGHDLKESLTADPGPRRGHESEGHASDCRMDSGFVKTYPYRHADQDVNRDFSDPDAVEQCAKRKASQGHEEVPPGDRFGKDRGDHQHGQDVVDDRQGQKKDLQTKGDAGSEQSQDPDDEGDVGSHRDRPTSLAFLSILQCQIDQGWSHHPTDGSDDRQESLARIPQFTCDCFAFDFQADDEKEDRHEDIVDDQVTEVSIDFEFAELESYVGMPELFECMVPGGVGDDQSDQSAEHQHHTAGGFDVHEAFDRNEPLSHSGNGDFVSAFAVRLMGHSDPGMS